VLLKFVPKGKFGFVCYEGEDSCSYYVYEFVRLPLVFMLSTLIMSWLLGLSSDIDLWKTRTWSSILM